jgi:general secretion pathway protein A
VYREHFGLRALPFENVPDPEFFFDEGDYHRVLGRMTDAVFAGRGLLAVAGPIGAGKTTVSQRLMADLPEGATLIWLAEPPETDMELLRFIAQDLDIAPSPGATRVFMLRDIRTRLLNLAEEDKRALMVIDESHLVNEDVLECIRLLNNLEEGPLKLLQIILLGQQELVTRLAEPELENFRQRIAGLEQIGTMDAPRLREYILHRLKVAGADGDIFTEESLEAVCRATGGVPRLTNTLCDRSLRLAFEAGTALVDAEQVHQAAMDIGIGRQTMHFLVGLRSGTDGKGEPAGTDAPPLPTAEGAVAGDSIGEGAAEVSARERLTDSSHRLALPLALFCLSLLCLTGSFVLYCLRSPASTPAQCLASLAAQLF